MENTTWWHRSPILLYLARCTSRRVALHPYCVAAPHCRNVSNLCCEIERMITSTSTWNNKNTAIIFNQLENTRENICLVWTWIGIDQILKKSSYIEIKYEYFKFVWLIEIMILIQHILTKVNQCSMNIDSQHHYIHYCHNIARIIWTNGKGANNAIQLSQ